MKLSTVFPGYCLLSLLPQGHACYCNHYNEKDQKHGIDQLRCFDAEQRII